MQPGVFTKVFPRQNFGAVFDAIQAAGIQRAQLIMCANGDEELLVEIAPELIAELRAESGRTGVALPVVSGIYNMAHPDEQVRADGLARLRKVIAAAPELGATAITICTGTRDPENMWRWHDDNDSDLAWSDLVEGLEVALDDAERHQVMLAIEPEPGNLVNGIERARRLLDQLPSQALGVTLDGANIVMCEPDLEPREVLDRAFAAFGDRIVVVHAKDCDSAGHPVPAGRGIVPWDHLAMLLRATPFDGPLIIHSVTESEVAGAVGKLREAINAAERG